MRPKLAINAGSCGETDCDRPAHCRGVCTRHYRRLHYVEHERARRGYSPSKRYAVGDTRLTSGGYVEVKVGAGRRDWVLEHRFVMQQRLGRPVGPLETVHHLNGEKTDNRPQNLELWSSRHPKGQRVADLLAFAHEIIDTYGAEHAA